jgi:hypothetical protein
MADVVIGIPFILQEKVHYCGPATLEMLLTTLGANAPMTPPSWQDQLWAAVEANTGAVRPAGALATQLAPAFPAQKCEWCEGQWKCWATTPGVLEHLANSSQTTADYSITTHTTEESATTTLMDTLDLNLPAAALIRGWQHWIAVDGYRHGGSGSVVVGGRNLNGVFIRDPWETAAIHYITWNDWESDYLKFVPCGDYQGRYVVMGGVRIEKKKPSDPPPKPPTNVHIVDPADIKRLRLRHVKRIIPRKEAITAARDAARELADSTQLRWGFDAAKASYAQLVQRLDDFDRYYYIVTFVSGRRETARVIVDAHDGHYSEVSTIAEKGKALPRYISRNTSARRLAESAKCLSEELRYQVRKGTVGEHPIAVWKPCGESTSPFLPFYQYSVGDSFVYYRFDGRRFDTLTEGPA